MVQFKDLTFKNKFDGESAQARMGSIASDSFLYIAVKNGKYYVYDVENKNIYAEFSTVKQAEKYIIDFEYQMYNCGIDRKNSVKVTFFKSMYGGWYGEYNDADEGIITTIQPTIKELKIYFYRLYDNCTFKKGIDNI